MHALRENLDLPGKPTDYHFAIQHVISMLSSRRFETPSTLAEIERLCLLDIQLIEAEPSEFRIHREDEAEDGRYMQMSCFQLLVQLYENEGAAPKSSWD